MTSSKSKKPNEQFEAALYDSYLWMIKNSVGSKIFRNLFVYVDGKKKDILRNGDLSCAFFVSSILTIFNLIDRPYTTVDGLVSRKTRYGWYKIKKPIPGAVLVWESKKFPSGESHKHIGFYIGNNKAISNSSKRKSPIVHNWTFSRYRKLNAIYWTRLLDQTKRHRKNYSI